ncbi:hypothetical protein ACL02U_21220 [Streptomyces sp. MS06]|uniref:hypothetical protein n=1 Tax=Streptomyces sp. MS06 TaxID=3385974 RepID=UPI0039A1E76C
MLLIEAWADGAGAGLLVLALSVPLLVALLMATGYSGATGRSAVRLGSARRRLGWAALVCVLGTLGVLAGLAAYRGGLGFGFGGIVARSAMIGVPYAVVAAFFVPDRWVRLGAVAVLAAGVAYGGLLGPTQVGERADAAEAARYRARTELLYARDTPPGMWAARADARPGSFGVGYHSVRHKE